MVGVNTILQKYPTLFFLLIAASLIVIFITSCGLFDKEIKQDQQIASFRRQLGRVQDSLDSHKGRITAYEAIIGQIDGDSYLITPRKKNNLLIEGNLYLYNEFLTSGNYKEAIRYSNVMISLDSTSAKGYYNRGCVYQVMSDDSLALLDYNKAILLNPDYTDAYYNRGIIFEEYDRHDSALSDYNKAIKLNPSYVADIYNNRGNVYMEKDMPDNAIEDYSKVISIDSSSVKAYVNRAWAHILQNEFDEAIADCNKALSFDSVNVNAYVKRASAYEGKKEYAAAIEDYNKVLQLDPRNKFDTHEVARQAIRRLKPLISRKG